LRTTICSSFNLIILSFSTITPSLVEITLLRFKINWFCLLALSSNNDTFCCVSFSSSLQTSDSPFTTRAFLTATLGTAINESLECVCESSGKLIIRHIVKLINFFCIFSSQVSNLLILLSNSIINRTYLCD